MGFNADGLLLSLQIARTTVRRRHGAHAVNV
jgi:hypothetical protein